MIELKKGYVQVYTGNGKGKTTAALGLGLRAAGNKLTVFMIQFLKTSNTGELEGAEFLRPYFNIFRFESPRGFFWTLNDKEKKELKIEIDRAYDFAYSALLNRECNVLILDEILGAMHNGLISESQILNLMDIKPENVEIIITGRNASEKIIEKADLVTEMRPIKHYMDKGVSARAGIEY